MMMSVLVLMMKFNARNPSLSVSLSFPLMLCCREDVHMYTQRILQEKGENTHNDIPLD